MAFSEDGKKLFQSFMNAASDVVQFSLDIAFDLSSSTKDGEISLRSIDSTLTDLIGIAFSQNGLKMYVGSDRIH